MHLTDTRGDATEPSYYHLLEELLENFTKESGKAAGVTVQPKKTKAGLVPKGYLAGLETVGPATAEPLSQTTF